ncbi:TetR/AcrR family transcriptional regulator [Cognatiyoonia sp. IB215182]|uniref:TetR/AcrR family transcriptional regulator n=1 Tax=Cognatiyoonia sp. IB215182 TaxID=3097353 RepID=UPI002A16FC39|nr:TetR/AcrR family transcriptional regulator [Cognatiyoonia sp. IB215182]MDX8354913.1 TetR/AcrR family transcriptional regulator [Cognatiyoonia sp. IB215182]
MTIAQPIRRRRKEARPQEILTAAMEEFDAVGFGQSTMAGIAKRAGISRTTIYLYYDTKEAIFEAAIRNSVEQAIDQVADLARSQESDFRALFGAAIDVIYDELVEGKAAIFLKILVAEGHAMPDLVAFYRREILSKGEAAITALIAQGIATGALSESCRYDDPRIYVAPTIFAALWMRVFDQIDPLDVDAFKDAHVRLVVDALCARQ